jgi:hypothetical protein
LAPKASVFASKSNTKAALKKRREKIAHFVHFGWFLDQKRSPEDLPQSSKNAVRGLGALPGVSGGAPGSLRSYFWTILDRFSGDFWSRFLHNFEHALSSDALQCSILLQPLRCNTIRPLVLARLCLPACDALTSSAAPARLGPTYTQARRNGRSH